MSDEGETRIRPRVSTRRHTRTYTKKEYSERSNKQTKKSVKKSQKQKQVKNQRLSTKSKKKDKKENEENDTNNPEKKLQFYLDSMVYRMPSIDELSTSNFRTDLLAKPKKETIRDLKNYQNVFYPKEKVKRIKSIIQETVPLTTEKLEKILKNERHKNVTTQKRKILREKLYLQTLHKLENQFKSQTMDDLTDKFINYVSHKCVKYKSPDTMTETMQRLALIIKRYIFLTIAPKTCFWQYDQISLDTLSMVLTEIVFNILYESQKYKQNTEQTDDLLKCIKDNDNENKCKKDTNLSKNMHNAIHNRSWIAANRKLKRILSSSKEKNNHMFRCM